MTFRDLTFWGLFKISLILEVVPALCLAPLILLIFLISPESIEYDTKVEVSGMTLNFGPEASALPLGILMGLILWVIGTLILTAILYFLGQKTPLGKVRIGT